MYDEIKINEIKNSLHRFSDDTVILNEMIGKETMGTKINVEKIKLIVIDKGNHRGSMLLFQYLCRGQDVCHK